MTDCDVTIIGAGPAGITAAIFLDKMGIPVTLIDKDHFPRDKICGDCLGGYAISVLHQISDDLFEKFRSFSKKLEGQGVHFFGPEHQQISIPALNMVKNKVKEVALCKRYDFDNLLLNEAVKREKITFMAGVKIKRLIMSGDGITIVGEKEKIVNKAGMLILASGSSLALVRDLTGYQYNHTYQAAGLRGYFSNIKGTEENGYIELHFLKELAPGYLWIFPLPDNQANVGLGLRSTLIKRRNLDLKKAFIKIIREDPYFKSRFSEAEQLGDLKGFPLALSIKNLPISGDRFLLAGDAAHLIEPLFGEGIGHAMYSGKFAAEQVKRCLESQDFSADMNRNYDKSLYDKLGSTLKFSRLMHRIAFYPYLMNLFFNRIKNNPELEKLLYSIINGQISKTPWNGIRFFARLLSGY
jgi:geranylgeranyl reductase family protein